MTHRKQTNAGAVLTIDLDAICDNWRTLKARVGAADCAAVVKADAYGLGAPKVAPALHRAGCRHFFVAHLDEAIALRPALPADAKLFVLHGLPPGAEREAVEHRLVPVVNSLRQLNAWRGLAERLDVALPAVLQVDTGMNRLGLGPQELEVVAASAAQLKGIELSHVMSHLVRAEAPDDPVNRLQLERFRSALARLPATRASLANSSGIFLGPDFHFSLVRPGAALYGIAPVAGRENPLRPVVGLQGKVVQTRTIEAGTGVGYGHTWTAARRSRIATVAVGYADGYLRSLGNRAVAHCDGRTVPIVGNVSMDTVTIDVTDVPEGRIGEGSLIELAGPALTVDEIARRAGTIGYEILTSLGNRYERAYVSSTAAGDRRAA